MIFTLSASAALAQRASNRPIGVAWRVSGVWEIEGSNAPIRTGDAIPPGSLLEPGGEPGNHSILVFLPDGQRILYECFLAEDCARAFRVPLLYRSPDPFAVEMLARIHAVLSRRDRDSDPGPHQGPAVPRDEALAVLDHGNRVAISGLAAALPNGRYTYDLQPFDHAHPGPSHVALEKHEPSITIPVPSPGLYHCRIYDDQATLRVDLLIAAERPEQATGLTKSFNQAKTLIGDWNIDYQGWPIHDFQRAYLESLVLGINPSYAGTQAVTTANRSARPDLTAEPAFFPKPGVFNGDTAVTLRCNTPGATIHFTVDGSQPFHTSQVYQAPIMVKGTELTIKAFAVAPGKKDSAVVTGIFRIQE
jgi:hypothetical protein